MSEAILEQQDIKNMEAAQEYDDNLNMIAKVAEAKWLAHFKSRHEGDKVDGFTWDMKKNDELWAEYKMAYAECRNRDHEKIAAKKYGFDIELSQEEMDNCKKMAKEVMQSEAGKKYVASVTAMFKGLSREMGIDPNDYQEDDKVPADPQGQDEEDSYKS